VSFWWTVWAVVVGVTIYGVVMAVVRLVAKALATYAAVEDLAKEERATNWRAR